MRFREGRLRFFNHDPSGPTVVRPIIDHVVVTSADAGFAPLAVSVIASPVSITGIVGSQRQLTAQAFDAGGSAIPGVSAVWQSSDASVVKIDANGLATLLRAGSVTVTASVDARAYSTPITITVVPGTPSDFVAAFNAVQGGATMLAYYEKGFNQTITANGASPTGFYCSSWKDAVTNSALTAMTPAADFNSGLGVACLATGEICGRGLENANSTGLSGGSQFHIDASTFVNLIPNSGNLTTVFSDFSSGITWGGCGKIIDGADLVEVGEDADANKLEFVGDDIGNTCGTRSSKLWDDGSNHGASFSGSTGGSQAVHWFLHVNATAETNAVHTGSPSTNQYWQVHGWGRDLIQIFEASNNSMASGRRVRWLGGSYGSGTAGPQRAHPALYVLKGHSTAAQTKLLCDYFSAKFSTFEDTRRLGYTVGDSEFVEHINLNALLEIQSGVGNFALMPMSFVGHRPQSNLFPWHYYLQGLDLSKRPLSGVAFFASEWVNATPGTDTAANLIIQNYYWMDQLRALDPTRVKICMHNMTYVSNFTNQQTLNDPAINSDLQANAVNLGHADAVMNYLDSILWNTDAEFYGPTGDFNRANLIWDGIHPWDIGQEVWRARHRGAYLAAFGEFDVFLTSECYASTPKVSLTAGSPTATPTWTSKNRYGTALGAKTFQFTTSDPTIATVDFNTGVITRVAVGKCYIKCTVIDATVTERGKGVCVVVCT